MNLGRYSRAVIKFKVNGNKKHQFSNLCGFVSQISLKTRIRNPLNLQHIYSRYLARWYSLTKDILLKNTLCF